MIESQKSNFERSVLVGIINDSQNEEKLNEFLEELEFLSLTAGGTVVKKFTQKINTPNPKTFIGKGKIEEIQKYVKKNDVSIVIFDDELSPTQQSNIEKLLKCKILDRTALILDIFAQRAKTSYAKTQVELAQYEYLLPRLKGLWTHLERQKGGIGMRGPGETEIETDRRIVRDKISLLKKKISTIDKQMKVQRGADAAAAWGRLKQLDKENNLADFIRSQGVEIYTPDLEAFRTQVQAAYIGSEVAATWPEGVLEKINSLGN